MANTAAAPVYDDHHHHHHNHQCHFVFFFLMNASRDKGQHIRQACVSNSSPFFFFFVANKGEWLNQSVNLPLSKKHNEIHCFHAIYDLYSFIIEHICQYVLLLQHYTHQAFLFYNCAQSRLWPCEVKKKGAGGGEISKVITFCFLSLSIF